MSVITPVLHQMLGPQDVSSQEMSLQQRASSLTAGKDSSRATRDSMTGENSVAIAAGEDSVSISPEGRARQSNASFSDQEKDGAAGNMPEGSAGSSAGGSVSLNGGGDQVSKGDAAEQVKQALQRQINQVKQQLEAAKQQMASKGGSDTAKTSATEADVVLEGEAQGSGESAASGEEALDKTLQSQVEILNQRLQLLYQQMMRASQQGGGQTAIGSAGIGTGGTGEPGGKGERISVG